MRVYCGDQREAVLRGKPGCGIPHSNDPEKTMKGELWVGVTLSGRSPVAWIPMKRGT